MTTAAPSSPRESVPCPLCASASTVPLFTRADHYPPRELFAVVRCTGCGLLRIDPRPPAAAIGSYYSDTYSWKPEEPVTGLLPRTIRAAEHAYRFHLLRYEARRMIRHVRPRPGAEILDVGCGSGDRLLVYRDLGLQPYGVEIGVAADYARDHLGLRVRRGILNDASYESGQFDLITLYNVFEHLHAPGPQLDEIFRLLRPGGHLVIEVPNHACLQFKFFGSRWAALDVPRDLYYWNAPLLARMIRQHGFELLATDFWTNWWHPPMIVLTLCPGLDPRLVWAEEHSGGGSGLLNRVLWAAMTLATPPFTFLESLLGRGSSMVVYARKP